MATGAHITCVNIVAHSSAALVSGHFWSETLPSAGATTTRAPAYETCGFEVHAFQDLYFAIGASPDATQTVGTGQTARIFVSAGETRHIFCKPGDSLAWAAA